MTITREQVADLQPGDVVEVSGYSILKGATIRGALRAGDGQTLSVGPLILRSADGSPVVQHDWDDEMTLTVVSRAPRPLYVNHPRTEPVPGDVARNEEDHIRVCQPTPGGDLKWWGFGIGSFGDPDKWTYCSRALFPGLLTLLVDGETGQVVP